MRLTSDTELAYCTNIHPAESWAETWQALKKHTLHVRSLLREKPLLDTTESYAIGLRLSALAAKELEENLAEFKSWLEEENCSVFTINGFPYGAFHNTRVKENVYKPDWTTEARLSYTKSMARVLSKINPVGKSLSISTLPGSFKAFHAYEPSIFLHLIEAAEYLEQLSESAQQDLHLGLEPEPLGHFENLAETLSFFERLWAYLPEKEDLLKRRIGVNYDTCHFALEFEDCHYALGALTAHGVRISKVHLSNALTFNPQDSLALVALRDFNEPTYLHQVILENQDKELHRFTDIPEFFERIESHNNDYVEGRCHFHVPLYEQPTAPFNTTLSHAKEALSYLKTYPKYCPHFEIETYTWQVLPTHLQLPIEEMICAEYDWVMRNL